MTVSAVTVAKRVQTPIGWEQPHFSTPYPSCKLPVQEVVMARELSSRVQPLRAGLNWFFMSFLVTTLVMTVTSLSATQTGWVDLFLVAGFFALPIMAAVYEKRYPSRKLKQWTTALSQKETESGERTMVNATHRGSEGIIVIPSSWRGVPVQWTLPSPLVLGRTVDGSMATYTFGDNNHWPDNLRIRWSDDNAEGAELEVEGPEAYLAASLTPDVRKMLISLCQDYALYIQDGSVHFDVRATSRALNLSELTAEIRPFRSCPGSIYPCRGVS